MLKNLNGKDIKPQGWIKQQLEIQARGLAGNLDNMWKYVRDSAWIGKGGDNWERFPYWLDGFVPMAYLLDDAELISRADKYMSIIMDNQCEDGWICPCDENFREQYDLWPLFIICKVLIMYYGFKKDDRIKISVYKAMKNAYELLRQGKLSLKSWGKSRWYEAFISLNFIKSFCAEEWIKELGIMLRENGLDYVKINENDPELWTVPINAWKHETHIVNIVMMLKFEAVSAVILGEKYTNKAEELWQLLEKYNGTAVGTLNGDECLAGLSAVRGVELCSVTELMWSFEQLYLHTGDAVWMDRLEKVAFNALPATISDDMWTHQYDQLTNQIACVRFPGKPIFGTNNKDAHLFGLEPNFGCCTANFVQGWPKLVLNSYFRTDKGIDCAVMLPCDIETDIKNKNVKISVETEYPFRNSAKFTVEAEAPVRFEFKVRIPSWAKSVRLNGEELHSRRYIKISKTWSGKESFTVEFLAMAKLVQRPFNLKALEYGPLVFALPIDILYRKYEYEDNGVERRFPYCDYEYVPQTEWNYGFASTEFEVEEREGDEIPFSSKAPRIVIKTKMSKVKWDYAEGYKTVCAKTPDSTKAISEPEDKVLYPYGSAKLRMTEMPKTR